MRTLIAGTAVALTLVAGAAGPAGASHGNRSDSEAPASDGNRSLSEALASDGNEFDRNWHDFDILTEAARAVLTAKPDSAVSVLTDGDTALTAFIPNDMAFRQLVRSLTGTTPRSERRTFEAVAGLGIDTVETVLLYHVVPGATITAEQALKADGAELVTAQGGAIEVDVVKRWRGKHIRLVDQDGNARDPRVYRADINEGNLQIAHAIDRVLRPLDLPPTAR